MKKNNIDKVSYSSNGELIIQFKGRSAEVVEEKKLTRKQKEIKNFLQTNPQTKEISANSEYSPSSKNREGFLSKMTGGELAVIGLVVVGVITLIIYLIVKATQSQNQ